MCGMGTSFKSIRKALEWDVKDLNFNRFCTVGPSEHIVTFFREEIKTPKHIFLHVEH